MSNLTECAFPAMETPGPGTTSFSPGFTKHEFAAIIIAAQLASQANYKEWEKGNYIGDVAYELAKDILSKF